MQSALVRTIVSASLIGPTLGWAAPQGTTSPQVDPASTTLQRAPYRVLDRVEGAHIDLAHLPIRPLHRGPQGELVAVDAERSELLAFDPTGQPLGRVQLPWGPVAVTSWRQAPGSPLAYLAVCRGSQCLAVVDAASLQVLNLIRLPAEPGDILVEPSSGHVFVSGTALDVVVEIDIGAGQIIAEYPIPSKRPTFLALDGDSVLVAPMLSGNNSMADTGPNVLDVGPGRVLDLNDPAQALQGLPDHDLFRITPGGGVEAVASGSGAVLFAVGVHPHSGEVWQLGTEANNKDPLMPGEPAVRGIFIENRLARIALASGTVVTPVAMVNLDDTDPATPDVQYDPSRSVGQPYALAFDGAGEGYVAGLLTSNITQLDAAGRFVREWSVGLNPRGLIVDDAGETMWVFAWNQRQIEVYDLTASTPVQVQAISLGEDPTDPFLSEGRRLFFDGTRSLHGNASCASCHVEGESDLLVWDLSDLPYDDKGPLVTQTLRGIADLGPFHWRGERASLEDFNDAFDGLMGSVPLDLSPGGEFEAFRAYLFSLEQPANPNQDPSRLVVSTGEFTDLGKSVPGDAVRGQDHYFDTTIIPGIGSCNRCHQLPTGTSNENVLDEPDLDIPRRNHFKIAPYNGIWRKEQSRLESVILANGTTEERPTLGSGVSATGLKDSLLDFVRIPLFLGNDSVRRDITAFLQQIDSGMAPAAHSAFLLRGPEAATEGKRAEHFLLAQAAERNCDVVILGELDLGAGPRSLGWLLDPSTGLFHSDDSTVAPSPLEFFVAHALRGSGTNMVLGLPVGQGRRLALDRDLDGLGNADELALGSDPDDPDSDGDGDLDGVEQQHGGDPLDPVVGANDTSPPQVSDVRVVFVTLSVAKIQFDVDELSTWSASWTSGQQSGDANSDLRDRTHTVILTGLRGDNRLHDVILEVRDLSGNSVVIDVPGPVRTAPAVPIQSTLFRSPVIDVNTDSNGILAFSLTGLARIKFGPFAPNRQLRGQVFVNGQLTQPLVIGTVSGADGSTTVDITQTGLNPGDLVEFTVSTLRDVGLGTDATWSFPDTPTANRRFAVTYSGVGP